MIDAQRNIDPRLSHALLMAGVLQYLPFLAPLTQKLGASRSKHDHPNINNIWFPELSQITDGDIESVGIKNEADRGRIADAFHMYTKMHNSPVHPSRPSAPQMEDDEACAPSAPSGDEVTDSASECVVCLDKQVIKFRFSTSICKLTSFVLVHNGFCTLRTPVLLLGVLDFCYGVPAVQEFDRAQDSRV